MAETPVGRDGDPERWRAKAEARLASLAKPPGALGTLEDWCVTLCVAQKTLRPTVSRARDRVASPSSLVRERCRCNLPAGPAKPANTGGGRSIAAGADLHGKGNGAAPGRGARAGAELRRAGQLRPGPGRVSTGTILLNASWMPRRHANRIPVGSPIVLRRRVLHRHERSGRRRRVQDRPRRASPIPNRQPFHVRPQIVLVARAFPRRRRSLSGMRVRRKGMAAEGASS